MKLVFCPHCQDMFKLRRHMRRCSCGKSGGHYVDALNAYVTGDAIPIGITNDTFVRALSLRRDYGMGTEFTAFIIPRHVHTVETDEDRDKRSQVDKDITDIFGDAGRQAKKFNGK